MGIDVDGGFAEYVRVAEKMAFKIPEDMPAHIAAFAEPLACVIYASRKNKCQSRRKRCYHWSGTDRHVIYTADEGFRLIRSSLWSQMPCGANMP